MRLGLDTERPVAFTNAAGRFKSIELLTYLAHYSMLRDGLLWVLCDP